MREVEAIAIAESYLRKLAAAVGCDLVITSIRETRGGFEVSYNSKKWIVDEQIGWALTGNIPFLIDASTGEIRESE